MPVYPDKNLIEPRFREALQRYIEQRIEPGDFMLAVLENNLKESIGRGDDRSIENLPHIVCFLYNDCPSVCWGSPEKVKNWLEG